ncbi:hypothetical protein TRFO_25801 [Tritrichomonas foetus]|uniref:Glycosyltransferase 61 catalytic domain-containing protein n=1 Tax=Tritrichomonas foetus TaxID=1144522 RepID=A0A1J4K938_9EUKA|nr:hypothetical protein TRFO_25801 [Tritrichomonas foetus]|eukprot:OHT06190.1 hypothetical protein TRFO_25801 [Tritrichomonas foetus]
MKLPPHLQFSTRKFNKRKIRFFKLIFILVIFAFLLISFGIYMMRNYQLENSHYYDETIDETHKKAIRSYEMTTLYFPDELDEIPCNESIEKMKTWDFQDLTEYVPNVEMVPIKDPISYIHQQPERPLLPRNFRQKLEGVHQLEISPGVVVLHNFSAIETHRVEKVGDIELNVTTFDSGFMKEHFIWFPPFEWFLPHGLTPKQIKLFWKQPENHWHFDDCKMWNLNVVWEIENGDMPISQCERCRNHNYTHHVNHCEWPNTTHYPSHRGTVFAMNDHYINISQHFMDNGIPHMATMSIGSGIPPEEAALAIPYTYDIFHDVASSLGFNSLITAYDSISAERLIFTPSLRVLHPIYYKWFRLHFTNFNDGHNLSEKNRNDPKKTSKIKLNKEEIEKKKRKEQDMRRTKIVVLPRGVLGGGGGSARIIYNLGDVVKRLRKIHGSDNVVIHTGYNLSFRSILKLYRETKAILGPHGGAFYNHFFADEGIDVIEMIPMQKSGLYPLQTYWNKLIPFAHLAFHSNVQLMNQTFWRYITTTNKINYKIDVKNFMKWIKQIPSMSKPGPVPKK